MRKILLICLVAASLHAQVLEHAQVPMRDGVLLATDIYLPFPGLSRYPTIVMRTPYGKEGQADLGYGFAAEGYAAVIQDVRGHGGSEGAASMFATEADDGYDTVEWIAAQGWSDGAVGSFGASYLGVNQYLMAGAAPPHLKCMFVVVASTDLYDNLVYPGGCFRKYDIESWADGNGEEAGLAATLLHPMRDVFWDPLSLRGKYADVTVPTVHVGGWYDLFGSGPVAAYNLFSKLSKAPRDQMLIMGPWTHSGTGQPAQGQLVYPPDSVFTWLTDLLLQWFGYYLKGDGADPAASGRVALYTMGDVDVPSDRWNVWKTYDDLPESGARTPYYFRSDGTINTAPGNSESSLDVVFNPADPVPTIGGANLVLEAGPYDQSPLLGRADAPVFVSPFLLEPLEATGPMSARVYFSSDVPDLDVAVRLTDIYPDGRWMLVEDGIFKARYREGTDREVFMTPETVYALDVDLGTTSYVFASGHRIGCIVAGSNYPRFDVNPQTGEPVNQATHTSTAHVRLYMSARYASRLILPSLDAGPHGRPTGAPGIAGSKARRANLFGDLFSSMFGRSQTRRP